MILRVQDNNIALSFNRTIQELKYKEAGQRLKALKTFNRTIQELKSEFPPYEKQYNQLLIEPFRN